MPFEKQFTYSKRITQVFHIPVIFLRILLLSVFFAASSASFANEIILQQSSSLENFSDNVISRPTEKAGQATDVEFIIFVLDIDAIDAAKQNFTANVYIMMRWQDPRLALDSTSGSTRRMSITDVWNPAIILANRTGLVSRSLPEVVEVSADGTVTYRQRFTGTLSQALDLSQFPMDAHTFTIHFTSTIYSSDEVKFTPAQFKQDKTVLGGAIAEKLSLTDWEILNYEALTLDYVPIQYVSNAGFAFRFNADRYEVYFFFQILLPMLVVVIMSCSAFWIQRGQPGVRISIATSSILTLIAHRFILSTQLPKLPYMTRLDYFSVGSTLLVFIALLGVVATSYMIANNHERAAEKTDVVARAGFPVAFASLLLWFFSPDL